MKASLLYEGKAKEVYQAEGEPGKLILSYKNDATAFNGGKKESFAGKGRLNNEIASLIFTALHEKGIKSHFIQRLNETEQLVHQTRIIPLEVVVRNIAAGSIVRRLDFEEMQVFQPPLIELFYKKDELDDPLINDAHALLLTDINHQELQGIKDAALAINSHLKEIFSQINITLVDFKLEFGWLPDGGIVLADEITPDTCRLWDKDTAERLDKDVFRNGTGDLIEVYEEILNRLEGNV